MQNQPLEVVFYLASYLVNYPLRSRLISLWFPINHSLAMPKLDSDTSSDEQLFADFKSPAAVEVQQLISQIQQSHELWYKMINLESWALASTMDDFLPGFWSRFLENRRIALKQFLKQKRMNNLHTQEGTEAVSPNPDQNSGL